eukprot:COSAG02_NODE_5001_length_4730_cov_106.047938_3_plen_148_part_00
MRFSLRTKTTVGGGSVPCVSRKAWTGRGLHCRRCGAVWCGVVWCGVVQRRGVASGEGRGCDGGLWSQGGYGASTTSCRHIDPGRVLAAALSSIRHSTPLRRTSSGAPVAPCLCICMSGPLPAQLLSTGTVAMGCDGQGHSAATGRRL